MDSILNHSENVNPGSEPVQSCTVEGSPFTCNNGERQWRVVVRKCTCRSSWCPTCWPRYGIARLMDRMKTFDWRQVRHLVLSLDPGKFGNGEDGFETVVRKRGIGEMVRNLSRVEGIELIDWVAVIEWYSSGYPHWHVLIEVSKKGRAGMIGHGRIKRHWPFGIYVWEEPIESGGHWKNMVGYFKSHGYFGESKGHQSKLPEWAMNGNRHIKRWVGKRQTRKRKEGIGRMHVNGTSGEGKGS